MFAQIDGVMKRAGGSLDNIVTMTVFIKESRYGDRIEIQAVGVVGDTCSNDNPCTAEAKAKKAQNK